MWPVEAQIPWFLHPWFGTNQRRWLGRWVGALSSQEVDTLSLGKSSLEVHSVFSTAGALGRTLENQAEQTDTKTLTTKDLCGPCPRNSIPKPWPRAQRHEHNIIREQRGGLESNRPENNHPDLGRTRTASNPETQTAQDDPCAQMAVPPLTLM